MNLHKFTCNTAHDFYLNLELPQPIDSIAESLMNIKCPFCHEEGISIHSNTLKVYDSELAGDVKQRLEEIEDKLEHRPGVDTAGTLQYYVFYKEDVRFLLKLLGQKGGSVDE